MGERWGVGVEEAGLPCPLRSSGLGLPSGTSISRATPVPPLFFSVTCDTKGRGWALGQGWTLLARSLWAVQPSEGLPEPGRWVWGGQLAKRGLWVVDRDAFGGAIPPSSRPAHSEPWTSVFCSMLQFCHLRNDTDGSWKCLAHREGMRIKFTRT